jgi:hypothetical protein
MCVVCMCHDGLSRVFWLRACERKSFKSRSQSKIALTSSMIHSHFMIHRQIREVMVFLMHSRARNEVTARCKDE